MKWLLAIGSLVLFVGCTDSNGSKKISGENVVGNVLGSFKSECYLNKVASELNGMPIYLITELSFGEDQKGNGHYLFYTDAACTSFIGEGHVELSYVLERVVGSVQILKMEETISGDSAPHSVFWLPTYAVEDGVYADMDATDGTAGPYSSSPTNAEIQEFLNDPVSEGVFLIKQ